MADSIVVLHVDDDADFAELTADFLEREDDRIEVVTETSAGDGLDRLASGAPDCIVSDYDMPRMDGLELLERVREDHPDLPFILFTGKGSEEVASEALSKGATDYLQKEPGSDQYTILANRVRNYVENARTRIQRRRQLEAIETAKEGIGILDENGQFIFVNESCADLYGYDPAELVGESWERVHPDDELDRMTDEVIPTLQEDGEWHGESVGLRADGSTFVEDHTLTRTADGEFICSIRDVTERKERKRELERYETIVEAMGDGVYALDETGDVIELNETVVEMVGDDYEDILGEPAAKYYTGEDREKFEAAIRRLLSEPETSVETVETEMRRSDGGTVPIEVNLTLLPSEDEEFRGTVGVVRDVSERRERKRELERYETLLQLMPDTVVVTDLEGTIIEIHGFEGWSGYERQELIGEDFSMTMTPEDVERARSVVAELVGDEDRSKATFEHDNVTKGGDRIPFENHITLLPPEDGEVPGTMSVLRDISERKQRERELQRQNERLEAFAGIVSHDLRNPLNVAAGRLELAREECESEHLAAVAQSHDRMQGLIEDLLALASETEPVREFESVELAEIARSAWSNVATGDATLEVETDLTVEVDRGRFKQLLENLLRNAVEHGGRDVTVRIGEVDGGAGFFVADDGPGIPESDRERVFESGYTTAPDGTGFGLSIVEEVAEAHGWEVSVTDAEAGGARFEIRCREERVASRQSS